MKKTRTFFFESNQISASGYGTIRFNKSHNENEEIISLDLMAIMEYWRQHNVYQRSRKVTSYKHDLPFDGCGKRIQSLIFLIKRNDILEPIDIHLSETQKLCFADGRHRVMLLSQAGYASIFAKVRKDESEKIIAMLGTSETDERLILASTDSQYDDPHDGMSDPSCGYGM